jgi:hypothetical protein
LRNTGSGFANVVIPGLPGVQYGSVAWSDYDNDGRLDFLLTGETNYSDSGGVAQVWRNTGSGFTNAAIPALPGVSSYSSSTAWGDFDNDGRPDLLLTGAAVTATRLPNCGGTQAATSATFPSPACQGLRIAQSPGRL